MDQNKDELLKAIRTLEMDAAEAIQKNQISKIDVLVAEQERNAEQIKANPPNPSSLEGKHNIKLIFLSLLFISLGIGGAYFLYTTYQTNSIPPINIVESKKYLITTEYSAELPVSPTDKSIFFENLNKSKNEFVSENETRRLDVVYKSTAGVSAVSGSDLLRLVQPTISGTFARSIQDEFLLGLYRKDSSYAFAIFKTDSYEAAYGGMLALEPGVGTFEDKVIENKDVRVGKDASGNIILVYSFFDKETLIIAENEQALRTVMDKIALSKRN